MVMKHHPPEFKADAVTLYESRPRSMRSRRHSTADPARHWDGRHPPKASTIIYYHSNKPVSRRPVESAQYTGRTFTDACWRAGVRQSLEHIAASRHVGQVVRAGEAHSVQNGTIAWQALGQQPMAAGAPRSRLT
jgi:hypothetical protein